MNADILGTPRLSLKLPAVYLRSCQVNTAYPEIRIFVKDRKKKVNNIIRNTEEAVLRPQYASWPGILTKGCMPVCRLIRASEIIPIFTTHLCLFCFMHVNCICIGTLARRKH